MALLVVCKANDAANYDTSGKYGQLHARYLIANIIRQTD